MKTALWIALILLAVCIPALTIWIFGVWIETNFSEWQGRIALAAATLEVYVFIAWAVYLKNERTYLFVQRILLRFRRTHTFWKFKVSYSSTPALKGQSFDIDESVVAIEQAFKDAIPTASISAITLKNQVTVTIDDGDRFIFDFDHAQEELHVTSSRIRVPSHLYAAQLASLLRITSSIERSLQPGVAFYGLDINFDKNPYFGFFVQNVPINLIRGFHCSFQTTIRPGCTVEANKTTIFVSARDYPSLMEVAESYLSLSETLVPS